MADIVVVGDNSTQAIVGTVPNADILVDGALQGAKGDQGDQGIQGEKGNTGGIVPITVSLTAPADPNVNDLWIDIT